jgi:uncharacterized protein (DUF2141 family)
MRILKKRNKLLIVVRIQITLFSFLLLYACASPGTPSGGDYDSTPPKFVKGIPAPNSVRFDKNKIELLFDEYLSIEKPAEKVIITPPQEKMPVIRALGKKITVELKDSLMANTTYTFDFTDGIVDNNEKNAIEGFTFAFSTGDVVDSLMVSGLLLNAENLEPMPHVMIGLHENQADSAFTSLPFLRTTSTNDKGQFRIRNIAPGTYKLFALNDINRNYRFDQPTEAIAFYDSLIVPDFEPAVRMDTIRIDSLTIDTIMEVHYNRFMPDDILLFLFQENSRNQYLSKTERTNRQQLVFHFNLDEELPPTLNFLDEEAIENANTEWYITEYSPDKKDITYWISDSTVYKKDTIQLKAEYIASDSLLNPVSVTDTLKFVLRNKEAPRDKKKKETEEKIDFLKLDITAKSLMDVFDTIRITFSEPLADLDLRKIQIQQKVDTLWENREFPIVQDTLNPRVYAIKNTWLYGQEFQLLVDSAAIFSIYGKWNDSINTRFKFNEEKAYGNLYVKIIGGESSGFGELLDNSEKVVRTSSLHDGELIFEDLKPGKYYLRYVEDTNENGKWDTGNYAAHQQPEKVYYFEGFFDIREYSENEQNWDIKKIPVAKQKPLEITKNKPEEKKPKRNEQNQNGQRSNTNSNSNRSMNPSMNNRSMQENISEM